MRVAAPADARQQLLPHQHGLTPSPQLGGPATDEPDADQPVRISVFEGDGGSTTADEIEYVPRGSFPEAATTRTKETAEAEPQASSTQQLQSPPMLGAEESADVLALLQEYDLSAGEVAALVADAERTRAVSSGAATSSGGGLAASLPRTPAEGASAPESPDSAFDFINFPPPPTVADAEVSVRSY